MSRHTTDHEKKNELTNSESKRLEMEKINYRYKKKIANPNIVNRIFFLVN